MSSLLQRTQNTGLEETRAPGTARGKPTWSQVDPHSLWGQLLLPAPVLVLLGLGQAPGVHDIVSGTALRQQLLPCVTANGVGLAGSCEILVRGESQ